MFQWPPANVGEGFSQNGIDELAKIRQMSLPSLSWNYTSVAYIIRPSMHLSTPTQGNFSSLFVMLTVYFVISILVFTC